jgi:predicted ATP-grasp superfamily ATP-dependent carboligase
MSGSIHYCFIARDSDIIVFEKLVNKSLNPRQLTNEAVQIVSQMEKTEEQARDRF